ncbi:MAG: hypothetical protein C4520_18405 [Candidatus Abyssobacteria bacterium SURF_5]|uniref:Uncharacterized protein n=1 Tax=Abyssobacteria bacterium (strain SURF_5) TaxID=2093360 RepID=A0A3A4ND53_ABYX5|nr:MAG: hypothetical protein C4520_18405 [Candidatus Abyssubacteria bacterium SURF_5]
MSPDRESRDCITVAAGRREIVGFLYKCKDSRQPGAREFFDPPGLRCEKKGVFLFAKLGTEIAVKTGMG